MNLKQMLLGIQKENGLFFRDVLCSLNKRGYTRKEVEAILAEIEGTNPVSESDLYLVGWYGWEAGGCFEGGVTGEPTFSVGFYHLKELKRAFRNIREWDDISTILDEEDSFELLSFDEILLLSVFMNFVPEPIPWPGKLEEILAAKVDKVDAFIAIEVLDEFLSQRRVTREQKILRHIDYSEDCDYLRDFDRRKPCRVCLASRLYSKMDLYHQLKSCLTTMVIRDALETGTE